jgi:hypothetical protein
VSTYRPAGGGPPQITPGDLDSHSRRRLTKGRPLMPKPTPPREIQLTDIEQRFQLAWHSSHPPISVGPRGGYAIRILKALSIDHNGTRIEKYDFFYTDDTGLITQAPRGHAKTYRPGRIPPGQLQAAIAKYNTNQRGQS